MASNPEALQDEPGELPNGMPIEALASILNAAGLEDLAFMAPEAVPDNALDLLFVWRTGPEDAPVIGGLHQRPRGEDGQMVRFANDYIAVLRDICPEGFSSELGDTEVISGSYALSTAAAECVTAEGADFVSLFFALDDFNYSVFYHMTASDNRSAAQQATDGVARVVRDLADQAAEAAGATPSGSGVPNDNSENVMSSDGSSTDTDSDTGAEADIDIDDRGATEPPSDGEAPATDQAP